MTLIEFNENDSMILGGEKRIDPYDGNAYVKISESPNSQWFGICDIFGGHNYKVTREEWLTWKEVEHDS